MGEKLGRLSSFWCLISRASEALVLKGVELSADDLEDIVHDRITKVDDS